MVDIEPFISYGNIVTILTLSTIIGGAMWKMGTWLYNKKADDLKIYTDRKAGELREHYDGIYNKFLQILEEMDDKLTKRADMVNGNVANIREDVLEIDKAIDDLFYNQETTVGTGNGRKRRNANKRRRRLRQIHEDRESQAHPANR